MGCLVAPGGVRSDPDSVDRSGASVSLVGPGVSTPEPPSSDWLLAQSRWPLAVSPVLVKRSHFAVSRFLGCVVFLQKASLATVKSPVESSLEFRLRLESHRAEPSRPAAANRLLSWAFAPYST
jgi:hypothetical protein